MKHFKEIIDDFENFNPLPLFFRYGYTPETIKAAIITSFTDFFNNKANLNRYAIDGLATTWVAYLTSSKEKDFSIRIKTLASFNKNAFKHYESTALAIYLEWSDILTDATNKYWSFKNLSTQSEQLELMDKVEASFQMLGQLIEGLIKPYIKFHYQLYVANTGNLVDKSVVDGLDLGEVVRNVTKLSNTILTSPLNISINQWRNIAYHHNFNVENNKIICTYGNKDNPKTVILTKKMLNEVIKSVYSVYKALKISETLIVYDNLQLIQSHFSLTGRKLPNLRDEGYLIGLYSSIGTQGFLVKDLVINNGKTSLIIQDLLDKNPKERGIHSSQFLGLMRKFSKTKVFEVVYIKKDGSTYLVAKISDKSLEKFETGKIELKELIKLTKFDFVGDSSEGVISDSNNSKHLSKNKNPFKVHLLSAIPTNEKYFSQSGTQINVKEFITDFSLAVFSNYLIFRELNYGSEKIKINIGKDGSTILLDDVKKIIINVPAIIKEKFIQQLIIVCVKDITVLFENGRLANHLIIDAKSRPSFAPHFEIVKNKVNSTD